MNLTKDEKRLAIFESASIPKAVVALAVPVMITNLVAVFYNMVDTYFVGQLGDPDQMAAVSLVTPLFPIYMAVATIIGAGGSACISRALGEGKTEKIKKISSFCFYASIFIGLIITLVVVVWMSPILDLLGTTESTKGYALDYLRIYTFGAVFVTFSNSMAHMIRGDGGAKQAMKGALIGTVANIILDPIMILVLNWGVSGAALATVIGNMLQAGYYLRYLLKGQTQFSVSPKDFTVKDGVFKNVISIGVPTSLSSVLMSIASILANILVVSYGTRAVAALGITSKVNMFVGITQIGLSMGVLPLMGYCYGSKNIEKMKKVVAFSMKCTVTIGVLFATVCMIGAPLIVKAFLDDQEVIDIGIKMIRAYVISGPVIGVTYVVLNMLQAVGKAIPSLLLSLSRQGLLYIPLAFLFNYVLQLNGLMYAQPVADILSAIIAVIIYFVVIKKITAEVNAAKTETENEKPEAQELCNNELT